MSHARLAPSKSERVLLCAASPDREAALPDLPGGPAANQGTNSHWVLEQALLEDRWPPKCIGDGGSTFLSQLPYTVDGCPPELRDQAHDCFLYAKRRQGEMGEGTLLQAEAKVSPRLYTGRDDSDGTVDVTLISNTMLEIADLKTGGNLVEPGASQLRLYALGKMAEYADPGTGAVPFETIRLTVFQPKRPGADTTERFIDLTPQELIDWAQNVWIPAAAASDDPNAKATVTESGCKYCKANKANTCAEYKAAISGVAQQLFAPVMPEGQVITVGMASAEIDPMMTEFSVADLSVDQISRFLEIWPLLKARGKDIESRGFELLKARTPIPGFKLVQGNSSRAWALDEEEQVKKLRNMKLKLDDIYVQKLRTPPQMQALGLPTKKWESVKKHIIKKEGSLTLAPSNDPRADAMPAVEFQPVETPATDVATTAPDMSLDFLNL